jgi:AraC-like DNA-binding protein
MSRLGSEASFKDALRRRLSRAFSNGLPQASSIARAMGMSERTFYRRLAEEGLTYRDVLREAQTSLAQELLSESDCTIAEIAFLTGFSEQSTFTRAFKRWVGQPPAQFREQAVHA